MKRLSPREKLLSAVVGGAIFLLINLIVLSHVFKKQALLRGDLASKTEQWKTMELLSAERGLWETRDAWLQAKQPKLLSEGGAGVQLLDYIKEIAKKNDIILENPAIGSPDKTPFYRAVPVNIETKSSWASLIGFLHEMQQPEAFVAFENARVQIEPTDPSLMRGKFKIGRWYAP